MDRLRGCRCSSWMLVTMALYLHLLNFALNVLGKRLFALNPSHSNIYPFLGIFISAAWWKFVIGLNKCHKYMDVRGMDSELICWVIYFWNGMDCTVLLELYYSVYFTVSNSASSFHFYQALIFLKENIFSWKYLIKYFQDIYICTIFFSTPSF